MARTLAVALEERKKERELAGTIAQALLYPAFLVALTLCFAVFLAVAGIPWIRDSNFIRDPQAIGGMYSGLRAALVTLVICVSIPAVSVCAALRNRACRARYWSLVFFARLKRHTARSLP